MADFTLNIPDDVVERVTTAICKNAGVEVSEANAKAAIIDYITRVTQSQETVVTPPEPITGLS